MVRDNQSLITLFFIMPLVPLFTTNDFNVDSLRIKYVVNDRAVEDFSVSRQARTPHPQYIVYIVSQFTELSIAHHI